MSDVSPPPAGDLERPAPGPAAAESVRPEFEATTPRLGRYGRSPGHLVVAATSIVVLVLVGWFVMAQRQGYQQAVERAERDTRNVAHLLAEHAARTFDAVGETLRAVGRLRADVARGIYRSQASIHVNLRTIHGGSPLLEELGWFDSYGTRVATSQQIDPPPVSAAQREFFRVPADAGIGDVVHVSRPTKAPVGGGTLIDFSRRLENLDGSFAGVAHGTLDPRRFVEVYAALDLGPGREITLLRRDGVVLARAPVAGASPDQPIDRGLVPRAARTGGTAETYHEVSPLRGVQVIGSFAVVPRTGGQLVVDMSVTRDAAFMAFWREFAEDAGALLLALVALVAGAGLLAKSLNRREALLTDLTAANATAQAAQASAARIARSEADLQRALAAEREMSAEQRRFISIASHEFRTPLTIIDGAAQRLGRHVGDRNPDGEKLLLRIRAAVTRMTEIIERTVSLSRVDEGRIEAQQGLVDMARLLRDACARQRDLAPSFEIEIEIGIEPLFVAGDPLLLDQAVGHVLSNAVKYSGRSRRIVVSLAEAERTVDVVVRDFGVGIPRTELPKLFTRFYRASNAGNAPGLGVGLHVVRSIMSLQGGTVELDSVVDRGTTVTLRMPRRDAGTAGRSERRLLAANG
ncbi:MAG: hypothetical protein JNK67_11725 [Alphaproteobacteria bacterium]|nr:hypothetical protein [Alphaproteobacteria bacterium]